MGRNDILKILREAKGYSQDYVGKKLGINQNTYSKVENGLIELTESRMQQLAALYCIVLIQKS